MGTFTDIANSFGVLFNILHIEDLIRLIGEIVVPLGHFANFLFVGALDGLFSPLGFFLFPSMALIFAMGDSSGYLRKMQGPEGHHSNDIMG